MDIDKSYISPDLAPLYGEAARNSKVMPNFPLPTSLYPYSKLLSNYMEVSSGLNAEKILSDAEKSYPGIGGDEGALQCYFQKTHSCPAIIGQDENYLQLVFPLYNMQDYISCVVPVMTAKDIIQKDISGNLDDLQKLYTMPGFKHTGWRLDLAKDIRDENRVMRDNFEKTTGIKVKDPARNQFKKIYAPEYESPKVEPLLKLDLSIAYNQNRESFGCTPNSWDLYADLKNETVQNMAMAIRAESYVNRFVRN